MRSSTRARNNRKKVTCFTKDNIMKFTDGVFHKVFDEIGAEYPSSKKSIGLSTSARPSSLTRPRHSM